MANLSDIKYYPDRFYIRLEGCDIPNLFVPKDDFKLTLDQAAFMHEYYHYLTNITTFQGVRSFHAAFCDLFRLVTIITHKKGLDAFPVEQNQFAECEYEVGYWKELNEIFTEDNINMTLNKETKNSPSKSFHITKIGRELGKEFVVKKDGQEIKGRREFVRIDIEGLQSIDHFRLSLGALDEFLSASVDQFLFEKDLANYTEIFKDRDFYPYSTFDEIQKYYGLRLGSREMIVVTYYVLHSPNPAVQLIEILERLQQDGPEELEKAPEEYMNKHFSIFTEYNNLINELDNFVEEARSSKRHLAAHLLSYYQDRFITANVLAKKDPLFFIRPFLIDNLEDIWQRQEFWIGFNRIRTCFPEPLMIQGKEFVTTRPCEYGADLTVLALAIYEIIESLEKNKVAKRLDHYKNRYNYLGDDDNCDDVASFGEPPLCAYWHRALNELGLYEFYRKNVRI